MSKERFIAHIDMDAFFAAVEQRDNPKLLNRPVIIGADPKGGKGRGVVSTCSYEARKFDVHSALPISIAYRRCPQAVFLPPDMEKYKRVFDQIYDIIYDFTPVIEVISIDEAFLDLTGSFHLFNTPAEACLLLKARIKQELGLTASLGLAPTKMAAKIASDLDKPDGFIRVKQGELRTFLWPLGVEKLWGLGKKSTLLLNEIGIRTIGDLAKANPLHLEGQFGKHAKAWWESANGFDERQVETDDRIKSVSNETTFDKDTKNKQKIEATLIGLSERVSLRLRRQCLKGKTITLKIRLEGFNTYTRAITLGKATNFCDMIYKVIKKLFYNFDLKNKGVRLVGVKVSNLIASDIRDSIFYDEKDEKKENIHKAIDKIKQEFGSGAICRAGSMDFFEA
ncbi:MAG: DNA polymerase IV [Omnitrophica bacterium]|nr:DNA polymerase IV [Candidatus Omnitrophota bacterium]